MSLPDVDFVMSTLDGFFVDPGNLYCPVFVFSKVKNLYPFVLIPDYKAMKGYENLREEIVKANPKFPWKAKISQVFWRGGPNGAPIRLDNWNQIPRVKLVLQSLLTPETINARFTNLRPLIYAPSEMARLFKSKGMEGKWVDQKDHFKYKYLIDIDGGACTFERYFWLLLSNSVVLKQETPNQQWYYGELEPYRHYIPIKEDLSDLMEQIKWVKEHDEEAKQIAQHSTDFVLSHLTIEDNYLYLYLLIVEYARLQKQSTNPISS